MPRFPVSLICALVLATVACTPTFNWRTVTVKDSPLSLMLPCKPDEATKPVTLGTLQVDLHMQGCKAGDATFTVAHIALPATGPDATLVLDMWQAANQRQIGASAAEPGTFQLGGVAPAPTNLAPRKVHLRAKTAQGTALESYAVYLAKDRQLFQAQVIGERIHTEQMETFMGGLKLP